MSGVQPPGERPGVWNTIGDLLRRIRALEESPPDSGGAGIQFDFDNQGGYLDVQTNDLDGDSYGLHFNDDSGGNGSLYEAEQSILIRTQDDSSSILIRDAFGGITLHSTDRVFIDAATFLIAAATGIDGGNNVASNFADGVISDDLATVGQIGAAVAAAIRYAVANSGTYLDVTTTGVTGISFEDTNAGSAGISLRSTSAGIDIRADAAQVDLGSGDVTIRATATGAEIYLGTGDSFTVFDSTANPILRMTEGSPDLHIPVGGTVVADL